MNLNHHTNDYVSSEGVRISAPLYIDLTQSQRKELLNAAREVFSSSSTAKPKSQSGISVTTANSSATAQKYLGCDLHVLRTMMFSRGGMPADLVLRLQLMTGMELVSNSEIDKALKMKAKNVKEYQANNPYNAESI